MALPLSRSPVEYASRPLVRSDASEVSTEDDRYDELIGMYANVKADDLPRVTVADMSPGITPDITPVKGSNEYPRPFASVFAREEGEGEDEGEDEAVEASEAARKASPLRTGRRTRGGSSSWAPDASYDHHGRRASAGRAVKENSGRGSSGEERRGALGVIIAR